MSRTTTTLLVAVVLPLAFFCGTRLATLEVAASPSAGKTDLRPSPVVVELFTSQGCSSCPPADELLSRLGREVGADIVPLSFHVDYWNRLGWRDPFSSDRWSRRQERYARALSGGRLYTPQVVVDGSNHCVGSDARRVGQLITDAARRPDHAHLELQVVPKPKRWQATVEVQLMAAEEDLELLVAVYESGLQTAIASGENSNRRLANDFVVRRLHSVAMIEESGSHRLDLKLEDDWQRDELGIVAFLQGTDSLAILGAAVWRGPAG